MGYRKYTTSANVAFAPSDACAILYRALSDPAPYRAFPSNHCDTVLAMRAVLELRVASPD